MEILEKVFSDMFFRVNEPDEQDFFLEKCLDSRNSGGRLLVLLSSFWIKLFLDQPAENSFLNPITACKHVCTNFLSENHQICVLHRTKDFCVKLVIHF
jgi:hypothetical protein